MSTRFVLVEISSFYPGEVEKERELMGLQNVLESLRGEKGINLLEYLSLVRIEWDR